MPHDEENSGIYLNPRWAGIMSGVLIIFIGWSAAEVYQAHADQAVLERRVEVIEKSDTSARVADTITRLYDTQMRLSVVEQKVEDVKVGVRDIQGTVNDAGRKLDTLLVSDARQHGKRGDE